MKLRTLAATAAWLAASGVSAPILLRTPKPEKYPDQRRAYLIGANCPEGERMRAAAVAPKAVVP